MPFVLESSHALLAAFDADGCMAPPAVRQLGRLQAAAKSVVEQARSAADALRESAQNDAAAVRAAAAAEAERLQQEHEAAWQAAHGSLQATAVAIAALALRRLDMEAQAEDKLQAAVRGALHALPEPPVRLLVSNTHGSTPVPLSLPDSVLRDDVPGLAQTLELQGATRSTGIDVAAAWTQVHNALDNWLSELTGSRHEKSGEPERGDSPHITH
jgi:hypothetical protein